MAISIRRNTDIARPGSIMRWPSGSESVLIAAQSGRALAQAACRAGLRPFVLDLFGDEDMLVCAAAHRHLAGRFGAGRRDAAAIIGALEDLSGRAGQRPLGLVLGSGFEGAPDLVAALAERHRLLGAEAATIRALKDPIALAALCGDLAIPHPAVTTGRITDPKRWLCKSVGGSGGSHIRAATAGPAQPGCYFQARVGGTAHSLNFLSDGRGIRVLAVTEQWSAASPLRPFRYAGAIAPSPSETGTLAPMLVAEVTSAVARLAARTGLRGLASADLLVDGSDWSLLEINPRPGATLDVLDRRATPLLALHIEAALGVLPQLDPAPVDAAGAQICYAARSYAAVPPLDWPDFVHDRPQVGSRVARDAPLCTITAQGADSSTVREVLRERARVIAARLHQRGNANGYRSEAAEHQRADGTADRSLGG